LKAFFDVIRKHFGPLSQSQVEGFELLFKAASALPDRHKAYLLATAWHETARTMQPIYERGPKSYFNKYEGRKDLGNTVKGDGYRFRGVGYVQLTGRRNFSVFSGLLGIDLLARPELAANPATAAKIMIMGMRDGLFTGKKMADFESFEGMRRVVNGTDRADDIAKIANKMLEAVMVAQIKPAAAVEPAPAPTTPKTDLPRPASNGGFWAWLSKLFGK
jgi:hypothetical protein